MANDRRWLDKEEVPPEYRLKTPCRWSTALQEFNYAENKHILSQPEFDKVEVLRSGNYFFCRIHCTEITYNPCLFAPREEYSVLLGVEGLTIINSGPAENCFNASSRGQQEEKKRDSLYGEKKKRVTWSALYRRCTRSGRRRSWRRYRRCGCHSRGSSFQTGLSFLICPFLYKWKRALELSQAHSFHWYEQRGGSSLRRFSDIPWQCD